MAGFGYHGNSSCNGNDWDLDAVVRFAYGDLLPQLPPTNKDRVARFLPPPPPPPTNDVVPFTPFLLQQAQAHLHDDMPDAVDLPPPSPTNVVPFTPFLLQQAQAQLHDEMLPDAVDLPPPTDPTAVVVGGSPGQGVFAAPEPKLEDLPDFADWDLDPLLQQEDLDDSLFDPLLQDMNVTVTTEPSSGGGSGGSTSRSRRRRNYRMVMRVLDGAPPPDTCSWRKYGQKSIKGSPNPRSYYRCSTDKQCKARKCVQRCGDDPRYLVVSYTRDHSHTEPLVPTRVVTARTTTGVKPPPPPSPFANIAAVEQQAPAPPPAFASSSLSLPATPLRSPFGDFFNDAFDVYVDTTPEEDLVPFTMLDLYDEPLDGFLFYTADELAPVGGGGGDNNQTFPMPYDYEYESAGGSSSGSDGSTASTAVGTGTAPIANVVDEMFNLESWASASGTDGDITTRIQSLVPVGKSH